MALVVMGHGAIAARHERKSRLRSVERLNLALLIDREHQRVLRRVQVKPDDIVQLLQELRIPTQLEGSSQMWFQAMTSPNAANRSRAQAPHLVYAASALVGSGYSRLLRRLAPDLSNHLLTT